MKYLIIIFFTLISCNNFKTEINSVKTETKIPDKKESIKPIMTNSIRIRTEIKTNNIDSVFMSKVNLLRDSLLSNRETYMLIEQHEFNGDCYGSDSLYYDNENRLIIHNASGGCSGDRSSFISIYNSSGLIYYNLIESDGGFVYSDSKVYYKDRQPKFGFQVKYDWDWETQTMTDSSSMILTKGELTDITELKISLDKENENIIDRVKRLNFKMKYDSKYEFIDTIQQVTDKRYYLIDSMEYVDRIK